MRLSAGARRGSRDPLDRRRHGGPPRAGLVGGALWNPWSPIPSANCSMPRREPSERLQDALRRPLRPRLQCALRRAAPRSVLDWDNQRLICRQCATTWRADWRVDGIRLSMPDWWRCPTGCNAGAVTSQALAWAPASPRLRSLRRPGRPRPGGARAVPCRTRQRGGGAPHAVQHRLGCAASGSACSTTRTEAPNAWRAARAGPRSGRSRAAARTWTAGGAAQTAVTRTRPPTRRATDTAPPWPFRPTQPDFAALASVLGPCRPPPTFPAPEWQRARAPDYDAEAVEEALVVLIREGLPHTQVHVDAHLRNRPIALGGNKQNVYRALRRKQQRAGEPHQWKWPVVLARAERRAAQP